jgi:hypothetical protein
MHLYFFEKRPQIAYFIEPKSGQFFNFYDQIQVTRIVHLAYHNMCEFCTMIPISLFITKIQNLKWGCKTLWRVLYIASYTWPTICNWKCSSCSIRFLGLKRIPLSDEYSVVKN